MLKFTFVHALTYTLVLYRLPYFRVYRYPIIFHSGQPIFQSDTDYYKHTIKHKILSKLAKNCKILLKLASFIEILFNYKHKVLKLLT